MANIKLKLFAIPSATATTRSSNIAVSGDESRKHTLDRINQLADGLYSVKSRTRYDFSSARDVAVSPLEIECDAEQITEIELTDGGRLFLRLDELQSLIQQNQGQSDTAKTADLVLRSTTSLTSTGTATRGLSDMIKSISLLDINWLGLKAKPDKAPDIKEIASHFVKKLQAGTAGGQVGKAGQEGLLQWDHQNHQWQPFNGVIPPSERPLLILIHGTASSTEGSFGDLWGDGDIDELTDDSKKQSSAWNDFTDTYFFQRVFAYEHDTLTRSPVSNAINLLRLLPQGQDIHLLSHSRGGLVGELLCLANKEQPEIPPVKEQDIQLYNDAYEQGAPTAALDELRQLNTLLIRQAPAVKRFVRVACPVRGTTLASGKLDIYLSVLATAVQWFARLAKPEIAHTVDTLKSFAIIAAKKRFQFAELPGLESMIPDSGLIRFLNNQCDRLLSPLTVIAGNAQADGFSRQTLLVALSNVYYWKRNDFVVETGSMQGGMRRTRPPQVLVDKNQDVNHFSYFRNKNSLQWIYDGLRPTRNRSIDLSTGNLSRSYAQEQEQQRRAASRFTPDTFPTSVSTGTPPLSVKKAQGTTLIIPAFAATHLALDGERIWLDTSAIATGKLQQLPVDATPQMATDGWLENRYRAFANYLEQNYAQNIVSFEYDWRLSTADNARLLDSFIRFTLQDAQYQSLPLRIVAHSTGGYIILKALRQSAALRKLLIEKHDMQLFLAGTPFGGSFHALEIVQGVSPLLAYLSMLDRQHSTQQLKQYFAELPGVIDMLPATLSGKAVKHQAVNKTLHKQLSGKPEYTQRYANRIHYIAGHYPRTASALEDKDTFLTSPLGDGSALWKNIPEWISKDHIWYMENTIHGNLLAQPGRFQALAELVVKGDTQQLSHTQPLISETRSLKHRRLKKSQSSLLYPDVGDIENVILRARAPAAAIADASTLPTAHIRILSGDLMYTAQPIVVGHYLQDGIKSAEAVIDKRLDNWLSNLYRKNLYPGKLQTAQVVTRQGLGDDAFGAVVVGLGVIGSLTPRSLRATLKNGFIKYGLHQRELRNNCRYSPQQVPPVALTSLLIGTGSGGVTIQDSLMALLRALVEANRILLDMQCPLIARLDIIELHEDVAISAARALQKIKADFDQDLTIEPLIVPLKGMRRRAASVTDESWWQHIQVLATKKGSLGFSPLTSRAGMDTRVLNTQTRLIDTLIEQSTHETRFNRPFSQTLFKLLIPNGLKDLVMNDNGMVLMLNKQAATYPWEMLVPSDEANKRSVPFAVEMGMIRKLHTDIDTNKPAVINHQVMIVGDPVSSFPELPGAQQEARAVEQQLLDTDFAPGNNVLIRARSVDIISRVMNSKVQILHLAGHGIYIPPGEVYQGEVYKNGLAGMVLGEGIFLTEHEVHQLETVPELVFINCCHLGKTVTQQHPKGAEERGADQGDTSHALDNLFLVNSRAALAANLGTAFIEAGAKCVVAAGWEVDDGAALEFASQFYEQMFHQQQTYGEACKRARISVYNKFPRSNTWGAYQCYGDPLFRFTNTTDSTQRRSRLQGVNNELTVFHSPHELVIWTENICARAVLSDAFRRKTRREARAREAGLPDTWKQDAAVLEALGNVYAKVDEDVAALECYQKAMQADNAAVTVRTLEKRVFLLTRISEEMFQFYLRFNTMNAFDEAMLKQAMQEIETLLKVAVTPSRHTLQAHLFWHAGLVRLRNDRATGNQWMRKAYTMLIDNSDSHYQIQGIYQADMLLDATRIALGISFRDKGKSLARLDKQLNELQRQLVHKGSRQSFTEKISLLHCQLLLNLLNIHQNKSVELEDSKLQDGYTDLLEYAPEKVQTDVLRWLFFLLFYLKKTWSKKKQPVIDTLQALYDQLNFICTTLDSRNKGS